MHISVGFAPLLQGWSCACISLNVFTQAGQLLDLHGFPEGLTKLLNEGHDTTLHAEVAWLLAFICAGSETHMHTMAKHGAAAAVAQRLMVFSSMVC